jgi:8-amino-7-oxononanoate synthase
VLKGLDVNASRGDELRRVLCAHTMRVLERLDELGVYTPNESGYPIIEIPLRDHHRISEVGRFLFNNGVYVTLAAYPLVPKNDVGFRVQLTSANTDEQVDTLLAAIEDLADRGELRLDGEEITDPVEAAA